jgi:hypothetical protein
MQSESTTSVSSRVAPLEISKDSRMRIRFTLMALLAETWEPRRAKLAGNTAGGGNRRLSRRKRSSSYPQCNELSGGATEPAVNCHGPETGGFRSRWALVTNHWTPRLPWRFDREHAPAYRSGATRPLGLRSCPITSSGVSSASAGSSSSTPGTRSRSTAPSSRTNPPACRLQRR